MTIELNSLVRSFDFEGRTLSGDRACYVLGIVEGFENIEGCDRYKIRVITQISGGKVLDAEYTADHVYPPVNGTPQLFSDKPTNFVELA